MVISRTKFVLLCSAVLLSIAAVAVKLIYFKPIDEKFFQFDYQRLRQAPPDVFILRPTRYADSPRAGCVSTWSGTEPRYLGRNASLEQIFATAYQCDVSRLVLPAGAPTNHFDVLVTVHDHPQDRLQ